MNKARETASFPGRVGSYWSKVRSSTDETDLSELLSEGQKVYRQASQDKQSKVLDQMKCFYDLLISLDRSFAPVDFGSILEPNELPKPAQDALKIAREAFGGPCEEYFPPGQMESTLKETITKARELPPTPDRILLIRLAKKWLRKIGEIYSNPSKYRADVVIELSPSLGLGNIEERVEGGRVIVELPVALRNRGPGPAFDTKLNVNSDRGCLSMNGETLVKKEWSIDELENGGIEVKTVTLRHVDRCTLFAAGQFLDAGTLDASEKLHELDKRFEFLPVDRDKALLSRERNPYVLTPPIPTRDWSLLVYERGNQLDTLLEAVDAETGGFIAVKGLRRTGKTTLLRHFCRKVSERGDQVLTVYIDCLIWRVKWEEDAKDGKAWDAGTFLHKLARRIVQAARHKDIALESGLLDASKGTNHTMDTERFQEFVRTIGKNLVLVFDEADSLGQFSDFEELLVTCFKGLVDGSQLTIIFAHELADPFWDSIWGDRTGIRCEEDLRIELLSREATVKAATRPARLEYSSLAKEYLWRITGGYPALVQLICHHLVRDLRTGEKDWSGAVRVADLKDVVRGTLGSKDDLQYIDYFRHGFTVAERRLLITLVQGDDVDPQTGRLTSLHVERGTGAITAKAKLHQRFLDEWAEERKDEDPEGNDPEQVQRRLRDAALGLKTKKIIDYYDEDVPTGLLRLRVGFLDLFLSGEQETSG